MQAIKKLAPVLCASLLALPATAQVKGETIYRTTVKKFTACGGWLNTAVNSPVTICNQNQIGVWQRACVFTKCQTDKVVRVCYNNGWDRFWAVRGFNKVVFLRPGPDNGKACTTSETRFCTSSTPPGGGLPPNETELTVHGTTTPGPIQAQGGASFVIAFSLGHEQLALPDVAPLAGPDSFALILDAAAQNLGVFEGTLQSLLFEMQGLPDPDGLQMALVDDMQFLIGDLGAMRAEMGTGNPLDPQPFHAAAGALRVLAQDLLLLDPETGFAAGVGELTDAADDLDDAGSLVAAGLEIGPMPCPDRVLFLDLVTNGLGAHLTAFADLSSEAAEGFFADTPPEIYCTGKTSSAGCETQISWAGATAQPTSGASDYLVSALQVQGFKNGLLFGSISGPAALPFAGGTLCVLPPTKRGPLLNSGGSTPFTCDGVYDLVINDGLIIPTGLDAGAGGTAWYQWWYRDPQNGLGVNGSALSNAIRLDYLP